MYSQRFSQDFNSASVNISLDNIIQRLSNNELPAFTGVLDCADEVESFYDIAKLWQGKFDNVVVIGVGGSSLGAKMLCKSYTVRNKAKLNMMFLDNVDSHFATTLINSLDISKTGFVSISKSGGTVETLLHTGLMIKALEDNNLKVAEHIIGISENTDNPLRNLLTAYGCEMLEHNPKVGGRYSVLSNVGLLPFAMVGGDVGSLVSGAVKVLQDFLKNPYTSPAFIGAMWADYGVKNGKPTTVLMPYGEVWSLLPGWFMQLWAESLGKDGKGSTPIGAVGPADQHATLQLYLDGPKDKLFTVIGSDKVCFDELLSLPEDFTNKVGADLFNGLTPARLLNAQVCGSADALQAKGVPVRRLWVDDYTTESLGALIMHFMLETICTAEIWNVNAFDQPAVEDGKKRSVDYLLSN